MTAPEPVTFTVHSVDPAPAQELALAEQRRTRAGRLKMLLVLLVCASPVVASYFTYFVIRPEGRTNYSALIVPTRSLPPALALQTLDGKAVSATSLHGQWLLVTVGPASCAQACEQRLYMQRQLREMLGRERDRIDKLWLVTDSGPIAPALTTALLGGVAPTTVLRADAAAVGAWLQPEAGGSLQDHLYLVDPMGEWMMRMPVNPDPARAKKDLDRVLRASAFWDQPGRAQATRPAAAATTVTPAPPR
jgi:hypothetical protein